MKTRTRGHYGIIPNNPNRPRVELKVHPGVQLTPPTKTDWYSQVPASSWGMLANGPDSSIPGLSNFQGCGDCTVASAAHIIDQVAWYAQNNTPAPVTALEALNAYEALTGYNPKTGANDNGCELQQVLQWWTQNGLADYMPSGFAQIDVTNLALVQTCVADFGAVYSALAVPEAFEQQFDNGQPWDVPTGRGGRQIVGGHAVPIVGYDADYLYVITWGAVQPVTYAAFAMYWSPQQSGEAWVAILPQSAGATGITFEGLDGATANADFQALTGSSASPFPVNPTPGPAPTPTPTPASTADQVYWAASQAWAATKNLTSDDTTTAHVPPHHHGR